MGLNIYNFVVLYIITIHAQEICVPVSLCKGDHGHYWCDINENCLKIYEGIRYLDLSDSRTVTRINGRAFNLTIVPASVEQGNMLCSQAKFPLYVHFEHSVKKCGRPTVETGLINVRSTTSKDLLDQESGDYSTVTSEWNAHVVIIVLIACCCFLQGFNHLKLCFYRTTSFCKIKRSNDTTIVEMANIYRPTTTSLDSFESYHTYEEPISSA